ncbi:hypothetical protein [Gemmobacter denitrificans]|uniref:GNAT family N-acetyltransferase n=1 Tax=Gemmobacter denitrificans TaxID=3123040 RepID=A0ABU8BRB1_9RHOB
MTGPRVGIGHNGGPDMAGRGWRAHCWRQARADLLPHLPIEVVRTRVRRAQALGLDYKTYAGVRATTGRDIVAFLFSSNALRVLPGRAVPQTVAQRLDGLAADRIGLALAPLAPEVLMTLPLHEAHAAPRPFAPWPEMRAALDAARGHRPGGACVLVTEAPFEMDWLVAGRLGACLPSSAIFG